jgi:adenylate cyclase
MLRGLKVSELKANWLKANWLKASWLKASWLKVGLISLAVTGGVSGLQQAGLLQPLELRAYDWMLRTRSDKGSDPRLLVVEFNETDLRSLQRITPDDATLAQAIGLIQAQQPRVIGLDFYRDVPQAPGTKELAQQLKADNLVAIRHWAADPQAAIPAPQGVPADRVGINNLPIDPDSVIRRNLLVADELPSFSLLLSLIYLEQQSIQSQPAGADQQLLKLGPTIFQPLQGDDSGYQNSDARGYQILLDYRTAHRAARHVSFTQLRQGQVPADWIRDKVVLMGNTSISSKDFFYTPFSATAIGQTQVSGVEIHAQMVSQLIGLGLGERQLIQTLPDTWEGLWMGLWALVAGTIAWSVRQPVRLLLSGGVLLAMLPIGAWGMMASGVWLPIVAPFLTALITSGTVVAYRAQQIQKHHRTVMILLGQSASKEIAAALWQNREQLLRSGKLPGQSLTATMLFTDLQGFSTISEQLSPEALMDWLSEYLGAMTAVTHRHQGIVNKFTGDGLFAVFGVPIARQSEAEIGQDAFNAVACGLEMGDRLAELNQVWRDRGLTTVQMRVGICTGPVVVGSLGSQQRMEYGIIGDAVNTASRLESCAKDRQPQRCRVLVAAETYRYIQHQFQAEDWGAIPLKGKQNSVQVYYVHDRRAAARIDGI